MAFVHQEFLNRYEKMVEVGETMPFLDPDVTAEVLYVHNACWHQSCRRPYDKDKVARAVKKFFKKEEKDLTIQPSKRRSLNMDNCIFCERGSGNESLHQFSSLEHSDNVKQMAADLQDTDLMVRVCGPDLPAMQAKYHRNCLNALKNRHRSLMSKNSPPSKEKKLKEAGALEELFGFIEESISEGQYFFKFQELYEMLDLRLKSQGIESEKNRTRLKERILLEFPDASEQIVKKQVIISFPEGIKKLVKEEMETRDHSYKANVLAKAAKIIRQDVFEERRDKFNGTFGEDCQEKFIPDTLQMIVSMMLNGVNINSEMEETQPSRTISQILLFNMKKTSGKASKIYHRVEQEPPLCTYIALRLHAEARSKSLIQMMFALGICPSYSRVLSIEDQFTSAVCERYSVDGVVAPCSLQKRRFSIGAMDNIDYNPSSATAKDSFHGTSISMFQVGAIKDGVEQREKIQIPPQGSISDLPESYTVVPFVERETHRLKVPWRPKAFDTHNSVSSDEMEREFTWLLKSSKLCQGTIEKGDKVMWAAFHAESQRSTPAPCFQGLFPLFHEKAATLPMVKHSMDVIRAATRYLNPLQVPIMVGDQPIFYLAKKIQWLMPSEYGEDQFVVWPGGLHLEMAMWKLPGELLDSIGWAEIISQAGVATSGVAKSMLKVSHLLRTRNAHQVFLLALHILRTEAWNSFKETGDGMTYVEWNKVMCDRSATFKFWSLISELVTKILMFVRSHRERNFHLYVAMLKEIAPFFFALDHPNYSRLVAIHLRDIGSLNQSVLEQFLHGNFVVQKTNRRFSAMPVDQCHEQNNKLIKTAGGFVGLTDNPTGLKRWMVAGPEVSRVLQEFESEALPQSESEEDLSHHQEGHSMQLSFQKQVNSVVSVVQARGNPFCDDFPELVTIDSRKVLDLSVAHSIRNLQSIGKENFDKFAKDVLEDRIVGIDEPLKRNNLPLPKNPRVIVKSKHSQQVRILQKNVEIFGQLYLSHRETDREEFFCHEAGPFPQSLSEHGKMHFASAKSDLLHCLIKEDNSMVEMPKMVDCIVLDGAAVVHLLAQEPSHRDFLDYAQKRFIPYVENTLTICDRVDIVFDQYLPDSLKSATREKRGSGERFKVQATMKLPKKWNDFLYVNENKEELFHFLAKEVSGKKYLDDKQVNVTIDSKVMSINSPPMPPCSHEEADSRIMVHILDALEEGNNSFMIRTVDTDIVIICMGRFHAIHQMYPDYHLWIKFGSGKNLRNIDINALSEENGRSISRGLPFFHAMTGCDTTSAFKGRAKKSAWQTWMSCEFITPVFEHLSQQPFSEVTQDSNEFQQLERFIVKMYSKTVDAQTVNEGRKLLFAANQNMEKLPPTKDALLQHVKRAVFQTGKLHEIVVIIVVSEKYNIPTKLFFQKRLQVLYKVIEQFYI